MTRVVCNQRQNVFQHLIRNVKVVHRRLCNTATIKLQADRKRPALHPSSGLHVFILMKSAHSVWKMAGQYANVSASDIDVWGSRRHK